MNERRSGGLAWQPDSGANLAFFEMYDTLLPGEDAIGRWLGWKGANADPQFSTEIPGGTHYESRLYDSHGNCFAIGSAVHASGRGEIVTAWYHFNTRRWEVISEGWMLSRVGKHGSDVALGAPADFDVWYKGDGGWAPTGATLNCECLSVEYKANQWASLAFASLEWLATQMGCSA